MKTLNAPMGKSSNLLLLILLFCFVQSCNKEPLDINVANDGTLIGVSPLQPSCNDACGASDGDCYPTSVLEAVTDVENSGNDRINMILYHYGIAFKAAFSNPDYKELALNALMSESEDATSLLELGQENPDFGAFLNEHLRQSMSSKNIYPRGIETGVEALIATEDWDANAYLSDKMSYEGYSYQPVIYEMKPVNTVSHEGVTILIAEAVNDCDDVAGWRGETEILMSEAEANNTEELIIFIAPGKSIPVISTGNGVVVAQERSEQLRAVSGKIKGLDYRYEKSGKSEIIAFVTGWEDDPKNPGYQSNKDAQTKFTKNQIKNQTVVTVNRSLGGIIENANSANYFLGFYEYDWYISNKNIKKVKCPCNAFVPDAGLAMKYAHEWYNTDKFCGRLSTLIPNANVLKTIDNKKGTFVLKRQPL